MDSLVLMDYEFGYPISKRESFIEKELDKKKTKTLTVYYKNKTHELPVIIVPINLPVYRIENIRTKSMQKEWLANHPETNKNFFQVDIESIEVQEVQHSLLFSLVKNSDLYKEFKKNSHLEQTEPLICTPEGVIVNGNRRLATWRELYRSRDNNYTHFANIQLAILPDNDPNDIYKLELALQVCPDLKEGYKWHAIAADCTEKFDLGLDSNTIAKITGKKTEDINLCIASYKCAMTYLEKIEHPNEWSLVDSDEYAFKEIVKAKEKLTDPTDQAIFEKLYIAFLSGAKTKDRLYKLIPQIGKYITQIKSKFKDVYSIPDEVNIDTDDPLAQFIEEKDNNVDVQIYNCLSEEKNLQNIVDTTTNVLTSCNELEREIKDSSFILKQTEKAAGALKDALEHMKERMSKKGINEQLNNIENYTKLIRKWVNQ